MKVKKDDMKMLDFGKSPHGELFTIAVALVAGAIAFYLRTDPNMPNGFHTAMIVMFVTAATLILTGIMLYRYHMNVVQCEMAATRKLAREREKLCDVPKLAGHWTYEVKGTELTVQQPMHSGDCEIKSDDTVGPRSFKIHGTRRKMWKLGDISASDCKLDWRSTWCESTDNGDVRLVYAITLDNKRYEGYATLDVQKNGKELTGDYSLHSPSGESTTRGTLTFTKIR